MAYEFRGTQTEGFLNMGRTLLGKWMAAKGFVCHGKVHGYMVTKTGTNEPRIVEFLK